MTDEEIREQALDFAKRNKSRIAKELTSPALYVPDHMPISAFMAGSPGAGKTEFSKSLIAILEKNKYHRVIRIDGDEIRPHIPGYTGNNSDLFQGAISLVVEKIHDYALHQKQTFVLDGTLFTYEKAAENIKRSLEHQRVVFIFYVYQKPDVAWRFTKAREELEGRRIPREAFIEQFFGAMNTVNRVRNEFGPDVVVYMVKKNFETNAVENLVEIEPNGPKIDDFIKERYTQDTLEKLL